MRVKTQIVNFVRSNRTTVILLVLGLMFSVLAQVLFDETSKVIPSYITTLKLIGVVLLSLALFMVGSSQKRYIVANIGLILVLVVFFEFVCFLLLGMPDKENKDFTIFELPPEHIGSQIGTVPWKDSVYVDFKMEGSDTVYNVRYTIDSNNIRSTPNFDSLKTDYALFFGCSIAFGHGLEDNQTFPHHFQSQSKYNSYNFAYTGYGTNQMLARLNYQNLREIVKGDDGIAVYVFFWDHIERAIGSMDRYTGWVSNSPYYYMADGKLKRNGNMRDGRPMTSGLYERIYQSSIIKYFNVGFPLGLNETHFDLVSEMISESKKEYKSQFGNDNFYVAIYPSYTEVDPEKYKTFLSYLDEKKIKYIDLKKDFVYSKDKTLGGDPHPNSETNRVLSNTLLKKLEKIK